MPPLKVARSRAVFLDRDGVLNALIQTDAGVSRPPWTIEELKLLDGANEAVELLSKFGFWAFVVTNQPDVGHGLLSIAEANAINNRLRAEIPAIQHVYACFHTQSDRCECRKPRPGMLVEAAQQWGLDLSSCWLIGDRWIDLLAGNRAGCRSVLVRHPHSWLPTSGGCPPQDLSPDFEVADVLSGAQFIVDSDSPLK